MLDPDEQRQVKVAVVIAGLSALVTKLIEWGVDELRELRRKKAPTDEKKEGA